MTHASITNTPRDRVTSRVARRARAFPRLGPDPLDTSGLDERDTALAVAIDQAVTRRWRTLEAVITAGSNRPWARLEPVVQAPLLVGAAQLLLLERVPDHAAINESVRWTKTHARSGAAGLVNAVLHRVADLRLDRLEHHDPERRDELPLSDGGAWRLRAEVFHADPGRRLAQTTSHADPLVERWIARLGLAAALDVAMHDLVRPPVIVAGAGADEPRLQPHEQAGFAVFEGNRAELRQLLAAHPGARVQDPTAAAAVMATTQLHPRVIVDLCAGRGTKTRQLVALHPDARIIATDTDDDRRADLAGVFADVERVEVVPPSGLTDLGSSADLVLADVPCSNTGVLARRLEAKYRFDAEKLESLGALQRQILVEAVRLLTPAGTLLYSTCSLEPEENEDQARWVGRWHGLEPVTMWSRLPAGRPGDPPSGYADGGFFAVLRRG